MCGIAGIVDLSGAREVPEASLRRMADALVHRGPDDEGYLRDPGVGLASRRLSIVGLTDGHQPIANEDGSILTVFNGELFEYPDLKRRLESKGHRFLTHCDTEVIPHFWEEDQERMFEQIRGQFAAAIYDRRAHRLVLARDRFGICPLYWTRQRSADGEWLLFASEIKALIASGMVAARPDLKGIDQVFHFFAVPGPSTCFEGVRLLQPGRYLTIDLAGGERRARIEQRAFWTMDFPDEGEAHTGNKEALVGQFEQLLLGAVERRLRADVPVVCYLSGGIDSSLIVAMAARIRGTPTPAFTVQIKAPRLDETEPAGVVARHVGARPVIVPVANTDVVATYPELIAAAEAPVVDTASAASLLLAREVHRHGFKVALAGEGSDEWLAGYPWHKVHRLFELGDAIPLMPMGAARQLAGSLLAVPRGASRHIRGIFESLGHHAAFHDVYSLMTTSRFLYFNDGTLEALKGHNPYLELEPDLARIQRWDSYNQSAYWGARIQLNGHLLSLKGDRVTMHSSVEGRYPFLDEDVFSFIAGLHPRWKMPWFRDKYLLRLVGERYLPRQIAWRRKAMFVAPFDSFLAPGTPGGFVDQLLSDESLRKTGWFDPARVHFWRDRIRARDVGRLQRTIVHMGMVGVIASQLWYQIFIDGTLADLPGGARAGSSSAAADCVRPTAALATGRP